MQQWAFSAVQSKDLRAYPETEHGQRRIAKMGQRQLEALTEYQEQLEKVQKIEQAAQSQGEMGETAVDGPDTPFQSDQSEERREVTTDQTIPEQAPPSTRPRDVDADGVDRDVISDEPIPMPYVPRDEQGPTPWMERHGCRRC